MDTATNIVLDSLGRVHELIPAVLGHMSREDLLWRPDEGSNSIGWLVWHLTRAEDQQMADLGGRTPVWLPTWYERFGLPYPADANGYGMSADEVAAFDVPSADLLVGYASAVAEQSTQIVTALTPADYDRVIDTRWNPPVTVAVRLVSIVIETAQHIGQAAYLRGLRERMNGQN